jgi:hypothetical protein
MPTTADKASRKDIPVSQQKLVWALSAGHCSFPGCTVRGTVSETDVDAATVIAEVAHIHAYEDDGPRADLTLSLKERNKYPNLLLLCPTHHTLVDKQHRTHTAEMLNRWKRDTEKKVTDALRTVMPQVTFTELKQITASLVTHNSIGCPDLTVIPPAEKIAKNKLSSVTHSYLAIALAKADVVRAFIDQFTRLDETFSSRLRTGFIQEYVHLKNDGLSGDELFQEMLNFATGGKTDLTTQAAGLAVLGYYFEACEVFER